MAERGDENPMSDEDYEDSRYYGNEVGVLVIISWGNIAFL
jgi:hypothetical protein